MKKEYLRYGLSFVIVVCLFGLLVSCGPGPDEEDGEPTGVATTAATTTSATTTAATTTGTTTTTEAPPPAADSISLGADKVQVLSDNTDFATITATVLDQNNVVMEDVEVVFSATGGAMSPPPPYRSICLLETRPPLRRHRCAPEYWRRYSHIPGPVL